MHKKILTCNYRHQAVWLHSLEKSADCLRNLARFQARSLAKMATIAGKESYAGVLGGLVFGPGDGNEDIGDEDDEEEGGLGNKLVQQSDEVISEWNDCCEHMVKLGEVSRKISRVLGDALVENIQEEDLSEIFKKKIDELGNIIKVVEELLENTSELKENSNIEKEKINKRCNFHNRGYCRKGMQCPFKHPEEVCDSLLGGSTSCNDKQCDKRHPYDCRYYESDRGCRRGDNCAFNHQTAKATSRPANEFRKDATETVVERKNEDVAGNVEAHENVVEEKNCRAEPFEIILEEMAGNGNGDFTTEMLDRILEGFEGKEMKSKKNTKAQRPKGKLSGKGKN